MWYGRKPDLSHIQVFGCMGYAYILDATRQGKLSSKAWKLRFVGYSLQAKGYSLIDETTLKVIIQRDVIFYEFDFESNSSTVKVNEVNDEIIVDEEKAPENGQVQHPQESPLQQQSSQLSQLPQQPQPQEEEHHYPRRQRNAPVR